MPEFKSFQDVYEHIRDTTGCSRTKANRTARRCYFDRSLCWELLGIEPSQLQYNDSTGERATDRVVMAVS